VTTGVSLAILLALGAARAAADPLIGDAGAALSTAEGTLLNPANAGFVDHSLATFESKLVNSSSLSVRYPGFAAKNDAGTKFLDIGVDSKPLFLWKPTAHLGIGGYFIPPVGLGLNIHKEHIPIVVFHQQNDVNLDAKGTLNGLGSFVAGYRFGNRFGIGLSLDYSSIGLDATVTPSDGGAPLATVTGSIMNTAVGLGLRFDPAPGRLEFGLVIGLVSISQTKLQVDSPLENAAGGDAGIDPAAGNSAPTTLPLSSVLAGIKLSVRRMHLLADLAYTRVDKNQVGFSIVDLQNKTKDLHDTLGVRLGATAKVTASTTALFGARYEPASLGPGSVGVDGTTGFGTMDLIMVYTGFSPLTPYWQAGGGVRMGFMPASTAHGGGHYYQLLVEVGLVYRQASLGIDADGEQPGAYLYKETSLPVGITYKF